MLQITSRRWSSRDEHDSLEPANGYCKTKCFVCGRATSSTLQFQAHHLVPAFCAYMVGNLSPVWDTLPLIVELGNPGYGKTILSALIIENLQMKCLSGVTGMQVVFFHFVSNDLHFREPFNAFRAGDETQHLYAVSSTNLQYSSEYLQS